MTDTGTPPARRRGPSTAFGLVLSLLASLAIVVVVIAIVVRPEQDPRTVDYLEIAERAQADVDEPLLAPELPEGWSANRAELVTGAADEVIRWEIGFITPERQYIGFVQGIGANASWVAERVEGASSTGDRRIGGLEWRVFDRRDADDPGNLAYALVTESAASTIVLGGTAVDAEFDELAEALAEEATR